MFKIPNEDIIKLNNVFSKQKKFFFVIPGIEGKFLFQNY
jgi:hypothetical protein